MGQVSWGTAGIMQSNEMLSFLQVACIWQVLGVLPQFSCMWQVSVELQQCVLIMACIDVHTNKLSVCWAVLVT